MSNDPKRDIGSSKASLACLPLTGIVLAGEVMRQGAEKYGAYNFRDTDVLCSVYFDAIIRHLFQWWEREDIDEDSGMPHLACVLANCALLLDGWWRDSLTDDRPQSPIDMAKLLDEVRG